MRLIAFALFVVLGSCAPQAPEGGDPGEGVGPKEPVRVSNNSSTSSSSSSSAATLEAEDGDPAAAAEFAGEVHNYIIGRLALLQRGAGAELIGEELVYEVDRSSLPEEPLALLDSLGDLCGAVRVAIDATELSERRLEEVEEKAGLDVLASLGPTLLSGGTLGLPALHSIVGSGARVDEARAAEAQLLKQGPWRHVAVGMEALNRRLADLRSAQQKKHVHGRGGFIDGRDAKRLDELTRSQAGLDEQIRVATQVLGRSPGYQAAHLLLARCLLSKERFADARHHAEETIALSPSFLARDPLRASAYKVLAAIEHGERRFESSLELVKAGLRDAPSDPYLVMLQAMNLLQMGDYESGLPHQQRLVDLAPQDALAHYNLACCFSKLERDADRAFEHLTEAIELGFRDMALAQTDTDFDWLRRRRPKQFRELTAPQLSARIEGVFLRGATVQLRNDSLFELDEVSIDVTARLRDGSEEVHSASIERMAPGEWIDPRIDLDGRSRDVRDLAIEVECRQGTFRRTIPIEGH